MCSQNTMKFCSETLDIIQLAQSIRSKTLIIKSVRQNIAPAPDVYTRPEANDIFDTKADKSETYTKTDSDTLLDAKADKTDTYTKTETDILFNAKADKSELIDSQTKSEDAALLLLKAHKSDIYTKPETDSLLDSKANVAEIVDKYDALLFLKANVADLTNYVDLTSAQTITGQKQFGVISVSSISKLSKNDASILLDGGGDMLVSLLVTQPQLQEVRDIATGKSKAYVFLTQGELNDQMAVQDSVAKLVIGDNLYIVDKEVTDYW
ncbi:MAG: hypothetical protein EZS28_022807 [Streblomastix strix]|uniref:Uncharacterized protein n=1 Tax=Streblomastix strix TaxID=222440 RepID=A0A5J4VH53_9EUKA|nr:MAG: hypothetical protein EZS28_022807 [Streblomastix strix]